MSQAPSGADRVVETLRWLAPLVSILVMGPVAIFIYLRTGDPLTKLVLAISAGVLVLLLLWLLIAEWRRRRVVDFDRRIDARIAQQLQPLEQLSQQIKQFKEEEAYRYLSLQYGWGYKSIQVTGSIDRDGGMRLRRNVTVQAFMQLTELEQSLHVRPNPTDQGSTLQNVQVFDPTNRARLYEVYPLPDGWVGKVKFDPGLRADEHFPYTLQEDIPAGTYRLDVPPIEMAEAVDKYDWLGWRIDRPMQRLSLQVIFPKGYTPHEDGYALRVYYQPLPSDTDKGRQHADEQARSHVLLAKDDSSGEAKLLLTVDSPILGLLYMIRWNPARL